MPAEHDVDDDVVLRRSWPALYDDVVRRGTRLRRRRRLAALSPALVLAVALGVGLLVTAGDDDEAVRTGPGPSVDEPTLPQQVAFARIFDGAAGGTAIFVAAGTARTSVA